MFEVPGSDVKSVHINETCVKGESPPEYKRHEPKSDDQTPPTAPTNTQTTNEEEENRKVRVTQ